VAVGQDLFRFARGNASKTSSSAATSPEAAPQAEKGDVVEPRADSPMQEPPPLPFQERSKPAPAPKEESKQFTTPSALATFAAAKGLRGTRTG
jgi:hypothetical protein